jgi:hypothetical protein
MRVGHHDAERNPGQTGPRAHIEDEMRAVSKPAGEHQRVTDVSVVDPHCFVGADASGFYCFGE